MSYCQFSLKTIETTFDITITEAVGIFADISPVYYSIFLAETLKKPLIIHFLM